MATNGSRSVTVTKWDTLKFSWNRTGFSADKNESYISWKMELISTAYGAISTSASTAWSVTVNGKSHSGSVSVAIGNNATKTLASGTEIIPHNNDGTKTFSYSFSQTFNITFSGAWIGAKSGSGSDTLDTIPRAATLTKAPDFNDETTNLTVEFNNPGNFDLQFKLEAGGDAALVVRDKPTKASPYTFVLTEAEKKKLRQKCTKNSLTVRFTVATYINGTISKWSWLDKTMTLINAMPTLSPTANDVNPTTVALTGDNSKAIKYHSNIEVSAGAQTKKEATVSALSITCGSSKITNASGTFIGADSGKIVFGVTDSRGNSASQTVNLQMVEYIPLTCSIAHNKPDALGNMTVACSGLFFNGSFGTAENELTVQYRYVETGLAMPETWNDMQITKSGNSYYASADFTISNFNRNIAYSFEVKAADKLESATGSAVGIKSLPVFHWSESDFAFEVPVKIQGSPITDFVVEQGTTGIWNYRKWSDGTAECWGRIDYNMGTFNTQSGSLYIADNLCESVNYPSYLFIEAPVEVASAIAGNYAIWLAPWDGAGTKDHTAQYKAIRTSSTSSTSLSGYISLIAKGKWK